MSVDIIDEEKNLGFTLTRFAGGVGRGTMYQINEGVRFVVLSPLQMIQLVSAFVTDHNRRNLERYRLAFPDEVKK